MSVDGVAVLRLPWDSDYFGLEIGRLEGTGGHGETVAAVAAADTAGIDCTYLLVPGDDPRRLGVAQSLGFRVVDVRTVLARPLAGTGGQAVGSGGVAGPRDAAWVEDLAVARFTHSRFVADGRFPADVAHGMFRRWVQRGFASPEQDVLVLPERAGFVIVGRDGERGSIELVAAAPSALRGTGAELLRTAHHHLSDAGCTSVEVVTQATNVPALRLYERAGYRVTAASYWLHRWRSECTVSASAGR